MQLYFWQKMQVLCRKLEQDLIQYSSVSTYMKKVNLLKTIPTSYFQEILWHSPDFFIKDLRNHNGKITGASSMLCQGPCYINFHVMKCNITVSDLYRLPPNYTPIQYKRYYLWVWPFYDHFWSFFGKLHEYLSQNLVTGGHFEVLNLSKSQLDQKLQQKTEVLLFPFFFNFGRKNPENLWLLQWPLFDRFW